VVEAALSAKRINWKLTGIWLILSGLVLAIGFLKYSDWTQSRNEANRQSAVDERSLLPVSIERLSVIEIAHAGALHRFERDEAGAWFYHAHGVNTGVQAPHGHVADTVLADKIAYAFSGLGRARIERVLDAKDNRQYGVARPDTLLLVYGDYGVKPLAQYAIGDVAPDTLSRYVLIVDESKVVAIADYQIENLMNLIQTVSGPPAETSDNNDQVNN
jgi:hypothetical protein